MLNPGIGARRAEARTLAARLVTGAAFGEARISQRIKRPGSNGGQRFKVNGAINELGKGGLQMLILMQLREEKFGLEK